MAPDDPQAVCVLTEAVCRWRQQWQPLVNRLPHYFVFLWLNTFTVHINKKTKLHTNTHNSHM